MNEHTAALREWISNGQVPADAVKAIVALCDIVEGKTKPPPDSDHPFKLNDLVTLKLETGSPVMQVLSLVWDASKTPPTPVVFVGWFDETSVLHTATFVAESVFHAT